MAGQFLCDLRRHAGLGQQGCERVPKRVEVRPPAEIVEKRNSRRHFVHLQLGNCREATKHGAIAGRIHRDQRPKCRHHIRVQLDARRLVVLGRRDPDHQERNRVRHQIDVLVYDLYGLTPEEIQLVEGSA
jgi:hypothetical protein